MLNNYAIGDGLVHLVVVLFLIACGLGALHHKFGTPAAPRKPKAKEPYKSPLHFWIDKAQIDYGITIYVNPPGGARFFVKNPPGEVWAMLYFDDEKQCFSVEILGGLFTAGPAVRVVSDRINRLNALAVKLNHEAFLISEQP